MTDISNIDIHQLLADRRQIAIIWCVEDVREVRPDLNDEQSWEVLKHAQNRHDACDGISWDTLEIAAECLYAQASDDRDGGNDE